MTATSITLQGRAAAEARMLDTCTIREASAQAFEGGHYTETAGAVVYEGPCEIQVTDSLNAETSTAGEHQITQQRLTLKLSVAVTAVRVNHVATIDSSTLDAGLVGRFFRIIADHTKSFATARRLQAEEVTARG